MLEVVQDLGLRGKMGRFLAEGPLDVASGEERMRLVQADVVVRVDPHATDLISAIDQDDSLI
jgi:hypothetical protein